MEGKVVKGNRITEGSIFGQLLLFSFPYCSGHFSSSFIIRRDAMVVGRFVGKAGSGRSRREAPAP